MWFFTWPHQRFHYQKSIITNYFNKITKIPAKFGQDFKVGRINSCIKNIFRFIHGFYRDTLKFSTFYEN